MSIYTTKALANLGYSAIDATNKLNSSIKKSHDAAIASQQNRISLYMDNLAYNENNGFITTLFDDGKTDNIDTKFGDFWNQESITENMVNNIGVSKEAVDKWFKDNGQYFEYGLKQEIDIAVKDRNDATVLANFDNDSAYITKVPDMDVRTAVKLQEENYRILSENNLDPNNKYNPKAPHNIYNTGLSIIDNSLPTLANNAVDFGDSHLSEDEFVARILGEYDDVVAYANTGFSTDAYNNATKLYGTDYVDNKSKAERQSIEEDARNAYKLAYSNRQNNITKSISNIIHETTYRDGKNFIDDPNHFEKEVIAHGFDIEDPMVINAMATYDSNFRAERLSVESSEKVNALKNAFVQYQLDSTRNETVMTEEGFLEFIKQQGIETTGVENILNEYRLVYAKGDKENEAFIQKQQRESQKSFIEGIVEKSMSSINTALDNGSLQPTLGFYSSEGVSTEKNEHSTLLYDSLDSTLNLILDGQDENLNVVTYFADVVEKIALDNGITDSSDKMLIASSLNSKISLDKIKSSTYGSIYSMIQNWQTYPDDSEIQDKITNASIWNLISKEEETTLLKNLSNRQNPNNDKTQYVTTYINEQLNALVKSDNERNIMKADIGLTTTLPEMISNYIQNNPTASKEEMNKFAESIIQDYADTEFAKAVERGLGKANNALAGSFIYLSSGVESVDDAYDNYLKNGDYFISANKEAFKDLKMAMKGGTRGSEFQNKKQVLDFATKRFFGNNMEYKDLKDNQKNNLLETIGIASMEIIQLKNIEKVAYATVPDEYDEGAFCKEVKLTDGRPAYLNRAGLLFTSEGSDGKCKITLIDKNSEEYKDTFSLYPKGVAINPDAMGLKSDDGKVHNLTTYYQPNIESKKGNGKKKGIIPYCDLTIEDIKNDINFQYTTGKYGERNMLTRWGYARR